MAKRVDRARYRRNKTIKFKKTRTTLAGRVPAGQLVEFQYGARKPLGEAGGWKGDPRPILIVFYDDQKEFIEGINTNYLSPGKLQELLDVIDSFDSLGAGPEDGKRLYARVKSIEPDILEMSYRKYKRDKIKSMWKLEVDLTKGI